MHTLHEGVYYVKCMALWGEPSVMISSSSNTIIITILNQYTHGNPKASSYSSNRVYYIPKTHAHVITHSSHIHLCYSAYLFNHHSKFQVLNMLSTAGMLITYHGYHLHMLTNMFDVVWFTL